LESVTLFIAILASILVLLLPPARAFAIYVAVLLLYPVFLVGHIGLLDISAARIVVVVLLLRCLASSQLRQKSNWCRLCPDSTGGFADISCGDPWYRARDSSEPGCSLILLRTEKGRKILHKTRDAGYIDADQIAPANLPLSQESLLNRRRHLRGRLVAMRVMGVPTPHSSGFPYS